MSSYNVYLDMDGVVADFDHGFKKVFPEWENSPGKNNITDDMWDKLHKDHPMFWANLQPMDGAWKLIDGLIKLGVPYIVLSALPHPKYTTVFNVVSGKTMWVQENLGLSTPAIFCLRSHKCQYASPNAILIDDSQTNCDEFAKKGGIAILHKTAYNTLEELKAIVNSCGRQES